MKRESVREDPEHERSGSVSGRIEVPQRGVQSVCKGGEGHKSALCWLRQVRMVQVRAEVHRVWEATLREPYLSVKGGEKSQVAGKGNGIF